MPRKAIVPRGTPGFESWPLDRLKPYKRNARTHSRAQIRKIANSIQAFGFNAPILVDKNGGIVAGHGRLEAARILKLDRVPVVRLDHLTPTQARAYMLADNRLALDAGWDEEVLVAELRELAEERVDLSLTGFDESELAKLLKAPISDENLDAVPDPPAKPVTNPGDLWILGEHRLMCGDATKAEDVHRPMDGRAAECVWTDPPYGVGYVGKTKAAMKIQNDATDASGLVRDAFSTVLKFATGGAPFYCAGPAGPRMIRFFGAIADAGWKIHQELIWLKDVMVLGHSDYHYRHEPIMYGYAPGPGRAGRGKHEGSMWFGDNSQTSVLAFDRPSRSEDHPTMKPVALVEYCLLNSSKRLGIVLDPFAGSGTTMIAAQNCGRVARLLEIDPKYCDVIVKRWETLTGGKAVLEKPDAKPKAKRLQLVGRKT